MPSLTKNYLVISIAESKIENYIMKLHPVFYYSLASLVLVTSIWIFYIQQTARTRSVSNVVNVSNENGVKLKTEIGTFEPIEGTDTLRATFYPREESSFSPSYKGDVTVQNYLFFDSNKKVFYWLKPVAYEGRILSTIPLTETDNSKLELKKAPPIAFVYLMVDKDTNNDQRININDRQSIAISDSSGLRFKVLIDQVDKFNGSSIVKNNRVFLIYQSANKLKTAEVDLRSQEIISNTELSNQL